MRVLITRPEREATALATALGQRGHVPVIAPLFDLEIRRPPADFAPALAACQAVLLTSANGARALADASDQRSKPILAVGDTTAATAEGLGFTTVTSASGDATALAGLVRERLDPAAGPLVHVSGVDVARELSVDGFEIHRFALYEARAAAALPDSARAALQARALDAVAFFSPRAATVFAQLIAAAGLADGCRAITAIAISAAAAEPLKSLPFKATLTAARPTRQSVLDEIDRLAEAGVQPERLIMSDAPSSPLPPEPLPPPIVTSSRGLGVTGAFAIGLIAAVIVLAAALFSLPYWPDEARAMWRGPAPQAASAPAPAADTTAETRATIDAAKRAFNGRLDDLDKRVRALADTAAQATAAPAPTTEHPPAASDPDVAALRSRVEALESKPVPANDTAEKDVAALRIEIATLRSALQALDQTVSGQKEQAGALADAVEKAKAASTQMSADEKKTLAAAHASAVIGIAARLSAALESGHPFPSDVALLAPLAQDDKKIAALATALQPLAQTGLATRAALSADFPAVAKTAMADDLADDSFGQRVLGKLKSLVSLRRVGADVPGDTVEAKLARAEAALKGGDLAKAVDLVKSLPENAGRAAAPWLARAEAHLAAQQAVDQLAAEGVALLGAAR